MQHYNVSSVFIKLFLSSRTFGNIYNFGDLLCNYFLLQNKSQAIYLRNWAKQCLKVGNTAVKYRVRVTFHGTTGDANLYCTHFYFQKFPFFNKNKPEVKHTESSWLFSNRYFELNINCSSWVNPWFLHILNFFRFCSWKILRILEKCEYRLRCLLLGAYFWKIRPPCVNMFIDMVQRTYQHCYISFTGFRSGSTYLFMCQCWCVVMVRLIIIIDAVVTFQDWMDFSVTYWGH